MSEEFGRPSVASHRSCLFLCASARPKGNSELLARRAAAALPPEIEQRWLSLSDHPLPAFADLRHAAATPWAPAIEGEARILLDATLWATDLVIVSPVYWYSLSAAAKLYLDHWTAWLRAPGLDFRTRMAGKTLWSITIISDEDPALAHPLRDTLRLTADYMKMHWGGLLMGFGNSPGDVLQSSTSLAAADRFFAGSIENKDFERSEEPIKR